MTLTGNHVVDYGCGSGILAVAALQLGADSVLAVDYDPQALDASKENAKRNQMSPTSLRVALPEDVDFDTDSGAAELVIANILAGPLMALSDTLLALLKPGGTLLLSGLITSQSEQLCSHYSPHIQLRVASERDGWVCLRGQLS
jgi:ribosomal protein L11 methyltransferase